MKLVKCKPYQDHTFSFILFHLSLMMAILFTSRWSTFLDCASLVKTCKLLPITTPNSPTPGGSKPPIAGAFMLAGNNLAGGKIVSLALLYSPGVHAHTTSKCTKPPGIRGYHWRFPVCRGYRRL